MNQSLVTLLLALTFSGAHAQQSSDFSMGISRISTDVMNTEISIRIFYPTQEQASPTRFGPWEVLAARNASPAAGNFPLIAVSHGLTGNSWNHHLMAAQLVDSGFIVAAVEHPDDLMRVGRPEHSVLRPLELSAAIDAVLSDNEFGRRIDESKIGAFGFSLGGFTVLAAAGGETDLSRIADHCSEAQNDPEFCIGEEGGEPLPFLLRTRRSFYSVPDIDLEHDVHDQRIKAIVAAAPVGLPFGNMDQVTQPIMLLRAGSDQQLKFPYHSENVHGLLPSDHTYLVFEDLHHYAFLSPFPQSIAIEVGEPAKDPGGFDRVQFLEGVNSEIVTFFQRNLSP